MRDPNPMFRPYARGWTSKPWKSYLSDLRIRTLADSARSTPRSCIGSAKRQGACTSTVCSSPVLGVNRLRRYRPPIDPESRQCSIGGAFGSPLNCSFQKLKLMTNTGGAPGLPSSSVIHRPSSGLTPRKGNVFVVT